MRNIRIVVSIDDAMCMVVPMMLSSSSFFLGGASVPEQAKRMRVSACGDGRAFFTVVYLLI
jgi:hypothetical protein